ncbi:MAG: GntR family transcriptional regulator [Caldilineaceae bacterium]
MALTKLPARQANTLSDEVTENLRTAIRNGSLKPGERLVERELAARLKVSRVPVRSNSAFS